MIFSHPRRAAALFLLCLPLLGVAACTVNPATGEKSFTAFMSPQEEIRIGREEHGKAIRQFGGSYGEKDLEAYVKRIGESLHRVSEMPDLAFTFTLLNTDMVNAFALPGGFVYVTRGIMALAENEAELAGILAHEIGHGTARHSAQRYSQAVAANLGLTVFSIGAQVLGLPGQLGDVAAQGAGLYLMAYSRDQELEADMLAVRYMSHVGYDPNALVTFFEKLEAHSTLESRMTGRNDADRNDAMATHPRTSERIRQAIELAQAATVAHPRIERDPYLDRIDGLLFGDDPSQGAIRGRTFLHPDLKIQFTVPQGFTLLNGPRQVVARHANGALILFDMVRDGRSPGDHLVNVWGKGLTIRNVERLDVNGLDAATGTTRATPRGGGGARDIRLVALRGPDGAIHRLMFATPTDLTAALSQDLQRTTYSVRALSDAEAGAIRPLRLRVVRLTGANQVDGLIRSMPFEAYSRPWFEVLNGLAPGQPPLPGNRVKVVGD